MQIEFESESSLMSDALKQHAENELRKVERRWGDQLTRIRVFIKDVNSSGKGGVDKHCLIEARPAGTNPVSAENSAVDAYDAVKGAAEKLKRVLEHTLDSRKDHH